MKTTFISRGGSRNLGRGARGPGERINTKTSHITASLLLFRVYKKGEGT